MTCNFGIGKLSLWSKRGNDAAMVMIGAVADNNFCGSNSNNVIGGKKYPQTPTTVSLGVKHLPGIFFVTSHRSPPFSSL
jgi:hypothetical protein